jgi:hypothetical protein
MHAAPGGQTGANIDDSHNDSPDLFVDQKYQDQLVELWTKLALRYKDEPAVAAYDLINEPLPIATGSADKFKHLLVPIYERITSAIRKVDIRHMITLEGYNWAGDWSLFDKPFDKNVFYQFHYYCWATPDHLGDIDYFIRKRSELQTPIWVGETGEKDNVIYWGTSQYLAANNIGYSFWPWKKMDTQNTPYSIRKPDNWDLISEYTKGGAKPDSVTADKILSDFLENVKLANCIYFEDVCNAILFRIPGKIEAENYGHDGYNRSYFVLDTLNKSKYYRTEEPVQIKLESINEDQSLSKQYIELQKSEWVAYDFNSLDNKKHHLTIRAFAEVIPTKILIEINNNHVVFNIVKKDFMEVPVGDFYLKNGDNRIKVMVKYGTLNMDWLKFN